MNNSIELGRATALGHASRRAPALPDDGSLTLPSLTWSLLLATTINLASLWPLQTALKQVMEPNVVTSSVLLMLWLSAISTPFVALGKGIILAVLAWSLLQLADVPVRVRPLFAILVRGEAILTGIALLSAAALLIRGLDSLHTLADLRVPLGVDLFVEPSSAVELALAMHLTVMHVAWFVFIVMRVAALPGVGRGRAIAATSGIWIASTLFAVLRAMMAA